MYVEFFIDSTSQRRISPPFMAAGYAHGAGDAFHSRRLRRRLGSDRAVGDGMTATAGAAAGRSTAVNLKPHRRLVVTDRERPD